MPTPAQTEIIDGLQSAADIGFIIAPTPIGNAVTGANVFIDVYQGTGGSYNLTVSTAAGVVAGGMSGVALGNMIKAAVQIAMAVHPGMKVAGAVAGIIIAYQGGTSALEVTRGIMDSTQRAALDLLNKYNPSDLNPVELGFIDGLQNWVANPLNNSWTGLSAGWGEPAFKDDFKPSVWGTAFKSPIALDLDGDGLEYISLSESEAYFDGDADGFAERTEWLDSDDGFLVRDLDANGRIDSVEEMFGDDKGTSAYSKLASLDSNQDGKLDSLDTAWTELRIWKDADGDGIADIGELHTLNSLDIASISTVATNDTVLAGHPVSGVSTFTRTDSTTGTTADILFETDQVDSWYIGDRNPFKTAEDAEVLELPLSRGYGTLPSLHIAMLEDGELRELVEEISALTANDYTQIYDLNEEIILKWAKVGAGSSQAGEYIDGKHLSLLEALFDQPYFYNLENTAAAPEFYADDLGEIYANFSNKMLTKFLVQGTFKNVFNAAHYDFTTDALTLNDTLSNLLSNATGETPISTPDRIVFWNEIARILTQSNEEFDMSKAEVKAAVDDAAGFLTHIISVTGTSSDDILIASSPGLAYADGSSDVFWAGAGNDMIGTGMGDDVVIFSGNSGSDTVRDGLGYDALILQNATPAQANFSISGDDLVISIPSVSATITVDKQFETASFGRTHDHDIEEIQFSNGVIWNQATLEAVAAGGAAPAVLTGTSGNNTLVAGALDLNIAGLAGADVFKINQDTSKFVTITDFKYSESDRIDLGAFSGITSLSSLTITDRAGHAAITLPTSTGDITLNLSNISSGQILQTYFLGNDFTYSAGTTFTGTTGNDSLTGSVGNDTISANAGADYVQAGLGSDIVYGWTGDDTVWGSYGHDSLYGDDGADYVNGESGNDVLFGGIGLDTMNGGEGNDSISGDADGDVLYGNEGNDTIFGGDGTDSILGGIGNDSAGGGEGNDTINGDAGNDTLFGNNGNDSILGGDGNDYIAGEAGTDNLQGGAGDDTIEGGASADTLNGGADRDTVAYTNSAAGVNVNLTLATAQAGGDAAGDILSAFENVAGSGFNDTITGDAQANLLSGGAGNDSIVGGSGNDTIEGGAGIDTLNGGADTDTVSYVTSNAAVNVNLALATAQAGGHAAGDILSNFENVAGSAYNDTISGSAVANKLEGGAGNDSLSGAAGNDTLIGGAGADTLNGGTEIDTVDYTTSSAAVNIDLTLATAQSGGDAAGDILSAIESVVGSNYNDTIAGSSAANTLAGSFGIDTVSYMNSTAAVNVNLALATAQAGGFAAGDILSGFENLTGSAYNDTLAGDAGANYISGAGGNDSISAGDGDDTLAGGAGADSLNGGNGTDTVDYALSSAAINLNLASGTAQSGGDAAGDILSNIENVIATNYNDTLMGGSAANRIDGGGGIDVISYANSTAAVHVNLEQTTAQSGGYAAGDILLNIENIIGSSYDDTLIGSGAANDINGGAGNDTVFYTISESAINVNLSLATAQSGGDAAGDILTSIENIVATTYNDTIVGSAVANLLEGIAGNDSIHGGDGNDTLIGGVGADTLNGGNGIDTASYYNSATGVNVNLALATAQSGGDALGDILISIENIVGSKFNDTITGNTAANNLSGGDGLDTISYAGSASGVTVNFAYGYVSGGSAEGDTISGFENILGSDHVDLLTGDSSANLINGGGGNDFLIGGAGADTLVGGNGIDTAIYSASSAAVTVNLGTGTATGGDAAGDSFNGIENVTGSGHNDSLTGDAGHNVLEGLLGNDTLLGGDGNDTIIGGLGSDYIDGGNGIDTVSYAASTDFVSIDLAANNHWNGHASWDNIVNVENVIGSDYSDWIVGNTAANHLSGGLGLDTLTGGDGNDTLDGGGGDDQLIGGDGDDLLIGGSGSDYIDGGNGIDTASYANSSAWVNVDLATNNQWNGDAAWDNILMNVENVIGSAYDDNIIGNSGVNVLTGGAGNDTLTGGLGNDVFYFSSNHGSDTINDFQGVGAATGDIIQIAGSSFGALAFSQNGANAVITTATGTITLIGVNATSLTTDDFSFAT